MSLSEIPAKMIDKTESFNETQLHIALDLTKLVYQSTQKKLSTKEVLHTFFECYNHIKEISPPPLDKVKLKKNPLRLIGVFIFIGLLGAFLYYFLFIYLGFNLKELVVKHS